MKIVIVGGGVIGTNLARELSEENHEIHLVEHNEELAAKIDEKLDAKVVVGEGSDPKVLKQAGIEKADMVIAVTTSDEVNLLVCSLAAVFGTGKRIARVRNVPLNKVLNEFGHGHFYVDEIINPEQVAAQAIVKVLQAPGSREVADFAGGKILLRSFEVPDNSPLCQQKIGELRDENFPWPFLIIAINRNQAVIIPKGDTVIEPSDRIYVLLPAPSLGEFLTFIAPHIRISKKVVIHGATDIGYQVAQKLSKNKIEIILIEENPQKAEDVAGDLNSVRVIHGSPSETDILKECGIEAADAFIAAADNDNSNLVSAVLAKKMGAKTTIITTKHPDYMPIMDVLDIDVVINPRFLAVDQILRLVRGKGVRSVTKLVECNAEALELIPEEGSVITKAPLKDTSFPKNSIIGAVMREDKTFLADGNTHIRTGDRVIVFCQEESARKVQKLFTRLKAGIF